MYQIVSKKPLKSTKLPSVLQFLGTALFSYSFYDPLKVAVFPMVLGITPLPYMLFPASAAHYLNGQLQLSNCFPNHYNHIERFSLLATLSAFECQMHLTLFPLRTIFSAL